MSFANPTPLQLGATGTLAGRPYRVVGRVVMGADVGGTTYYWNEFNIVNDAGENATLVYEETERGGEWKLFTLFEPAAAMSAAETATRREGDSLNLDGTQVRVTLVDESRVYYIEGEAPEGVEVGDIAHYFNAEAGNRMIVVSWTGEEVEYYRGANLPRGTVAKAFGLAAETRPDYLRPSALSSTGSSAIWEEGQQTSGRLLLVAMSVLLGIILFGSFSSFHFSRRPAAVKHVAAPASPVKLGGTFELDGKPYRVQAHSVVEVRRVGSASERHEYQLTDDEGATAWLIQGFGPEAKTFCLFTPLAPIEPLRPTQAAAVKLGETVNVDGLVAPVQDLFQCVVRQSEGGSNDASAIGEVSFGFFAEAGPVQILTRWNNTDITFLRGHTLSDETLKALRSKP